MIVQKIVGLFPVDRPNCACQKEITELKKNGGRRYIECPREKRGMYKYLVTCAKCKENIAVLYAPNKRLEDWCDLHYLNEKRLEDGVTRWYGCAAVNVSPIDLTLGFECFCGNDTRDFRANGTLRGKQLADKIKETQEGRVFGNKSSKFKVKRFKEGDL